MHYAATARARTEAGLLLYQAEGSDPRGGSGPDPSRRTAAQVCRHLWKNAAIEGGDAAIYGRVGGIDGRNRDMFGRVDDIGGVARWNFHAMMPVMGAMVMFLGTMLA